MFKNVQGCSKKINFILNDESPQCFIFIKPYVKDIIFFNPLPEVQPFWLVYSILSLVIVDMPKSCVSFFDCLLWGSWDQARTKVYGHNKPILSIFLLAQKCFSHGLVSHFITDIFVVDMYSKLLMIRRAKL
jgi:hypothetical protein